MGKAATSESATRDQSSSPSVSYLIRRKSMHSFARSGSLHCCFSSHTAEKYSWFWAVYTGCDIPTGHLVTQFPSGSRLINSIGAVLSTDPLPAGCFIARITGPPPGAIPGCTVQVKNSSVPKRGMRFHDSVPSGPNTAIHRFTSKCPHSSVGTDSEVPKTQYFPPPSLVRVVAE